MHRYSLPLIACLLLVDNGHAQSQPRAAALPPPVPARPEPRQLPPLSPHPQLPWRMPDHCPLEYGCPFGIWQACEPLEVQRAPEASAAPVFRLAALERFRALRADLVTTRFGRVRVEYPMATDPMRGWPSLPIGTEVLVRNYDSEGGYGIWADGRAWDVEGFWSQRPSARWPGRLLQAPALTWWVEVENLGGQRGWLGLHSYADDGIDLGFFAETVRMHGGAITAEAPDCADLLRGRAAP